MAKRHIAIVMCLLVLGAALAAQVYAQETPTLAPEQATVAAAVSTLIAQTQSADTQMQMTGTIQAALQSALTATAQAQIQALTATPTPTPITWSNVALKSTTDIDLVAGPARTAAYLAPDGEKYAYLRSDTLCLYTGATAGDCTDLDEELRGLDTETLRWSPDSRYVAFTEDFFRTLRDPDIWVWDTVSNELHNLTDDGQSTVDIAEDTWKDIDLLPHWLPDGRILFLRYTRQNDELSAPEIYTVNADGSGLEPLGTIQLSDPAENPIAVYAIDASATHLVYAHAATSETPDNGVWISDLDGKNARQIIQISEPAQLPVSVELSPDERYVLVGVPMGRIGQSPTPSLVNLLDVETGELLPIDPTQSVSSAGWTPEGSGLIYTSYQVENEERNGLYVSDTPGKAGWLLLAGRYYVPTGRLQQAITWGTNDAVLLSRSPGGKIVLVQLEH